MHRVFADEQKPFHVEYVEADVNDEDDNNESKEFYKVLGVKPDVKYLATKILNNLNRLHNKKSLLHIAD
jgi:hypothetical protein